MALLAFTVVYVSLFSQMGSPASQPAGNDIVSMLHEVWTAKTLAPQALAPLQGKEKELQDAVSSSTLWPEKFEKTVDFWQIIGADGQQVDAAVYVPKSYTPEKAWPLIIALHGTGEDPPHQLAFIVQLLGDERVGKYVIVAPQSPVEGMFACDDREIGLAANILPAISKRLRIDTDQVYLAGYSKGGHCSFVAASLYPDRFAGVMPLAGTFLISPFFQHQSRLLLPNLAGLPVWVLYGGKDTGGPKGSPLTVETGGKVLHGIADTNQAIGDMLAELSKNEPRLSSVKMVLLPEAGHGQACPTQEQVQTWLESARPKLSSDELATKQVKRFRAAHESWLNGVRATKLEGAAFDPTQNVKISAQTGEAPEQAAQRYFDQQFGLIDMQIDRKANQLRLTTRKVNELEVWLSPQELDFDKPINISVNGTVRYQGPIKADAKQMVYWLRLTGDTSRLMCARLLIPKTGPAVVNPPDPPQGLFASMKR